MLERLIDLEALDECRDGPQHGRARRGLPLHATQQQRIVETLSTAKVFLAREHGVARPDLAVDEVYVAHRDRMRMAAGGGRRGAQRIDEPIERRLELVHHLVVLIRDEKRAVVRRQRRTRITGVVSLVLLEAKRVRPRVDVEVAEQQRVVRRARQLALDERAQLRELSQTRRIRRNERRAVESFFRIVRRLQVRAKNVHAQYVAAAVSVDVGVLAVVDRTNIARA